MKNKHYQVGWSRTAHRTLEKLFNIDPNKVFRRSKWLLSRNPFGDAYGIARYPGFEYNGYYWTLIHNVIVLYKVSEERQTVFVNACYYANTEKSHEIFWGIDPNNE